ncbi:hypothetical protein IVA80_10890 [Bradyrhizobium sp. 139]|uniref:hypothetical protein n=1 Tax=Bradyrhizobium sp. 139 TaxID=2782616 RepID=UPI001FF72E50|nr:hypothetical protein [Bradyrhizobium sp. 139]MCK1741356.1 hypothetical protein [Bradyrhizobium sp. 139]
MTFSDDECIAIAVLTGATFERAAEHMQLKPWSCHHPSEDDFDFTWVHCCGDTQADAARRYCIRHHLI